jgi:excinuclease ABC subunit B
LINRPTGLVDPELIIKPSSGQIDDLISEIKIRSAKDERCLVTTLTKKMAEDLSEYLSSVGLRVRYLHSEVKTIERVKILRDLRLGDFDVLVGINLLREGLDLPEVSLVAILDADKEGFLRSKSSLVQTSGRAARHIDGKVILYADKITDSMQYLIDETDRRRSIQLEYNKKHNITPKTVKKSVDEIMQATRVAESYKESEIEIKRDIATDKFLNEDKKIVVEMIREEMLEAAENLEFEKAAKLRDEMNKLEKEIKL